MKNLPATIGFVVILALFVFFRGNPDRAVQAAPVNDRANIEIFQQDTFPHKPLDTTMRHHQKGKNKMDTTWKKHRRDTL
ncbi:MAG: hypothetical protein J7623_14860 [Chitinophaga sp.]|uniref:hypothetical protein n=1 Tax=Chitinophaga sp. TaxID=1869181 RepID=UPI001B2EFC99|nr:hypothetical protein [Chitinophaga sp.]MBO9729916.1 hypothetical protein [Chitinophaga sp.]